MQLLLVVAAALSPSAVISNGNVSAHGTAIGVFDNYVPLDPATATVRIQGWALNTSHPATQLQVRVLVDGGVLALPAPGYVLANTYRPDVGAAYPCCGNYHGILSTVTVPFGTHTLCLQANNSHGAWYALGNCHTYTLTLDAMYPTSSVGPSCQDSDMFDLRHSCRTDNAGLYYCYESTFGTAERDGVNTTMALTYDTTELHTHPEACVTEGSGETDIVYRTLTSTPNNAIAITHCDDAVSTLVCDQHYVTYRSASIGSLDSSELWKLACHETGHAVGFTHGANADPVVASDSLTMKCLKIGFSNLDTWLGSNHASYVNSVY